MKKLATLMTAVVLVMMSATMVSCGESDDYDYYFDLDRALTEYFSRYGDFGTDDRTTADWFDHYYPYASDYDYRSFINAVNADINNSRTTMARYLNGEWEGPLRMYFKNQAGQTVLMVTHSIKAASHAKRVLFLQDGEVYHQLYRGDQTSEQLYAKISDTLTVLTQGGELHA